MVSMKTPCELMLWYVLPAIRKELARQLIKDYGLSQVEVARKLGITDSAISQYLSAKRAKIQFTNKKLKVEIKISAGRIFKGNQLTVIKETCRICALLKPSDLVSSLYKRFTS